MSPTYQERKALRRLDFQDRHGMQQTFCIACYGTGRYDHTGSPRCGACDGTGFTVQPGPLHPRFAGRHARRRPNARCKNCGDVSDELLGCPGAHPPIAHTPRRSS